MSTLTGRLKREHDTLVCMTRIYCAHHHDDPEAASLCPDCAKLMAYAERRLEKCPYGSNKPTCANCPIHCYKPAQRQMARDVMRFAGPRMTWRHPWRAMTHLFDKLRKVEHPMKMRDELRRRRTAAGRGKKA
ncbi:MAG: nitrous oxide-stimulated promoter family protein [Gammaproteobacteria bacterium]|jgi:hypothetical protein|nr:nitrous oxide-stimulated promoter family protein [Gammaproteobacteria bacterium]